jgi:transposase
LIDLGQTLKRRPDLAVLVGRGIAAIIERLLEVEKERDEASRRPMGDSRTTHAPPSTDPRPKPRSQRRKSGKKTGGQPGHEGHRLEPVANPDQMILHKVAECQHCKADLSGLAPSEISRTQVFDLPKMPLVVTEHQLEKKTCPDCGSSTKASAPQGAEQPTQYGPRLAAFATYLHAWHFVPLDRTAECIETITGHRPSEAWICSAKTRLSVALDPFVTEVTGALRASASVCCDETGFRFLGRRFWCHVCCTALLTLFLCSRRRGYEGTAALGVLPGYTGIAIHDCWAPYFLFMNCGHGICNEHLVRELEGVHERDGQPWAKQMQMILYEALDLKRRWHASELDIPDETIANITTRYEACLRQGFRENPTPTPSPAPKRGPVKRGKNLALLDRMQKYQTNILLCLHDRNVPWSNNQAERDIRPIKGQQKVSGGFRTENGATEFCRIRSYLSTTSKNGINPFEAIVSALAGKPWSPTVAKAGEEQRRVA